MAGRALDLDDDDGITHLPTSPTLARLLRKTGQSIWSINVDHENYVFNVNSGP